MLSDTKFSYSACAGLLFIICLLVLQVPLVTAQTQTLVLQPGPSAGIDALIRTDSANINYGTSADFPANTWTAQGVFFIERSLIFFDLTVIPVNSTVISAELSFSTNQNSGNYQLDAGQNASYLLRVLNPWNQMTVTWNNQPAFSMTSPVILPQSTSDTQHYYVDVTTHVADMVANPSTNYGWMFKLQTEALYRCLDFASSNNPVASWRPKLTVVYCAVPGPAGMIAGPDTVCKGDAGKVYTVSPIPHATFYVWNLPAGIFVTGGANTNSITASFSPTAASGDITVYGSDSCSNGIMSPVFHVTLLPHDTAGVSVTASSLNVCQGTPVTFTANPVNGGASPAFQWKVNGANAGTNNAAFTYAPANGDLVQCILTSDLPCVTESPTASNSIIMTVNNPLPVSVTISASSTTVCAGTSVIFTAVPINPGTNPSFQWKVNGVNSGTNNAVYTYTPANADVIQCILTSDLTCISGNPATSNSVTMTVNPLLPVSVTISSTSNPVCAGAQATFAANPGNPGTNPFYQWKVNALNAGTNSPMFSYTPVNGDIITCILTSDAVCPTGNPATSNSIVMIVNINLPVSLSISASVNPVCPGTTVIYTAFPANGGITPVYQWKVNGVNQGTNSNAYSYIPLAGDSVRCTMTSTLPCVINNPASSNKIVMSSLPAPVVSFPLCFDSITTIAAMPFALKGGIPLGGTYSGAGVNSWTGVFTPSLAGVGTKTITYSYTNVYSCTTLMNRNIIVQAAPVFSCGNILTDIRDNNTYPTILIGTQCWMQKNLNYGTSIQGTTEQTDNCVNEKYCYSDNAMNCSLYGGLYQWDELMAYTNTPGSKGFCPPGWHIPTQTEWMTLFNASLTQGMAGKPLQDSIFNGFRAKESGVDYSNITWKFQGFATIYWSSNSYSSIKALSHGMNLQNFGVSDYYSNRSNAFAVRCLKD